MRALEDDLGCQLIDRVAKQVVLTSAGEKLLRHAEAILKEMEAARVTVRTSCDWEHGALRVGASTAACQHIIPTVLREFRESFPKCVLKVEPGDQAQQFDLLQAGKIDLALMLQPVEDAPPDVSFFQLFDDELCFFVSPRHPWAGLAEVPKAAVESQLLIIYGSGSYTFRLVQRYFAEADVMPSNVIELGSMEAIKEMAKLGLGAGIFAPWIASAEIESGALVALPLGRRRLHRKWGWACRSGKRLVLAEETFIGLCQAVGANLSFRTAQAVTERRSA